MAGMTLIELMCVLIVVAMLSAYALPLYREAIARGRRLSVTVAVQATALEVEARIGDDAASQDGVAESSLAGLPSKPEVSVAGRLAYRLAVRVGRSGTAGPDAGTRTDIDGKGIRYRIEAVPVRGGPMQDDRCGTFILDSNGRRYNRSPGEGHGRGIESAQEKAARPCWAGGA